MSYSGDELDWLSRLRSTAFYKLLGESQQRVVLDADLAHQMIWKSIEILLCTNE